MTTGNIVKNNIVPTTGYHSQRNGNNWYFASNKGTYSARAWNGTDRLVAKAVRPPPIRRVISTIDRFGRPYKRSFVINTTPKRVMRDTPHPYTVTWETRNSPVHTMRVTDNVSGFWSQNENQSADGIPFTIPIASLDANRQLMLVNKLREQINGSEFNAAVALGEGREALQMIGDTAVKLARAAWLVRRGHITAASHVLAGNHRVVKQSRERSVATNWLELQYGWLPLLSDIRSGAELLAHRLNVPFVKRYVVRTSVRLSQAEIIAQTNANYYYESMRSSASRQIIAYVSEPPSVAQLSGLLDPEIVAWELLPFSFIADWFLPIGDWLEARAFSSKLGGTFVTTDTNRRSRRNWKPYIAGNTTLINDTSFKEVGSCTRTVSTTLAVPRPNVKSLDQVLSWKHAANAIALVTLAFKTPLK